MLRLADNIQVRQESWGLLFYASIQHRLRFVKSGDWLHPGYFDGTWTYASLVADIARRRDTPAEVVERSLQKLLQYLTRNGLIVYELC
jgi:putative mycofactocin binding protein MftB